MVKESRNWMKLWLGMAALVLCLMTGRETTQAFATQYSRLYVDGVYLVWNGELLGTKLTKDNGTATYDPNTNVLTLENYHSTRSGVTFQDMPGITIVVKGENSLTSVGPGIYAYQEGDVTICGGGILNITAGSWEESTCGIGMQGANLTIENCTLNVHASYIPIGGSEYLWIKDSTITAVRTGDGELNDPNQNNNIYNERYGFPGLGGHNVVVENSTLDITGINYAIDISETMTLSENMEVTDETGQALHLVKLHWPNWWMNEEWESYTLAYSATTAQELYNFDELPNRVLIKPIPAPPKQDENTGDTNTGDTPAEGTDTENPPSGDNAENSGDTKYPEENTPEENEENGGNETASGKKQVTQKINQSYYRGVPSSGKVTYVKPASKKITGITIPSTVKINGYVCKVTAIDKNAFKGCKKLKSVKIGKNVQTIGERAFYQCKALQKIGIPSNVKSIKKEAFAGCKNLKNVTFQGKKVTSIGKNAFKNTKKKIKISVPKSKYKAYKKLLKGAGLRKPVYKKI